MTKTSDSKNLLRSFICLAIPYAFGFGPKQFVI